MTLFHSCLEHDIIFLTYVCTQNTGGDNIYTHTQLEYMETDYKEAIETFSATAQLT